MNVGIKFGPLLCETGTPGQLYAFFSTVAGVLEHGRAGSRFPVVSGDFYQGHVDVDRIEPALAELRAINHAFADHPASALIWDADEPTRTPPPGEAPSAAASLSDCFVTPSGRNLFDLLFEAFTVAHARQWAIDIRRVPER